MTPTHTERRCIAETKVKRGVERHTLRCELDEGHEGMHKHESVGRTAYWAGDARKVEDDTRWRYGFGPS